MLLRILLKYYLDVNYYLKFGKVKVDSILEIKKNDHEGTRSFIVIVKLELVHCYIKKSFFLAKIRFIFKFTGEQIKPQTSYLFHSRPEHHLMNNYPLSDVQASLIRGFPILPILSSYGEI